MKFTEKNNIEYVKYCNYNNFFKKGGSCMETYGLIKMGLDATNLRSQTIAHNIANANTPGYKRKYVTFEETLAETAEGKPTIEVKESNDTSMRYDGNNVDLEVEKVNQASTSLQYNALVSILNIKIASAKNVITGR